MGTTSQDPHTSSVVTEGIYVNSHNQTDSNMPSSAVGIYLALLGQSWYNYSAICYLFD